MPIPRAQSPVGGARPRSRNNKTTSSPAKRSKRVQQEVEEWSTDEDELERRVKATKVKNRLTGGGGGLSSILRNASFSLLRTLVLPTIPYLLLFGALYIAIAYARYTLYSSLSVLPASLQRPLSHLANLSIPLPHLSLLNTPLTTLSCATLGIGCRPNLNLVSTAARSASLRARHALTVFDHLVSLAAQDDETSIALHPVEIWELATAVRYTSQIEEREFVSSELSELGDSVRDVKDSVIMLNAQGMNAFTWIVHEFTRLEELISRAATSTQRSSKQEQDLTRLLDHLFDKISTSLNELLQSLDKAIPSATLASDKSRRIFGTLRAGEEQTARALSEKGWVEWMKSVQGSKGRQLRRDLELTRGSAEAVVGVWNALEGTRESLLSYRNNVGFFKAGVVGYHLSGNELSVEDEVASLKSVMDEMKETLSEARGRTKGTMRGGVSTSAGGGGRRELPAT